MSRIMRPLSLFIALGLFAGYAAGDDPPSTWELDPSGKWTQTDADINFGIRPAFSRVVAEGELSPAKLAALAQHLATQRFNTLPERVGTDPEPNKRLVGVTIGFGKRSATLDTERGAFTDACPEAGSPKADEWARFVAVALVVQDLFRESKAEPKLVAKAGPLTMRLVAKKDTYALDLGGKSPNEFRKLLKDIDPFGRGEKPIPPGPVVDLEFVVTNTSDKPVTIMWGGDDASTLNFELKGPGAVGVSTRLTTTDLKVSTPVTIAPGRSFTHPVTQLASYPRGKNSWYWTEPGEYTLTARWQQDGPKEGEKGSDAGTEPIKLKVVAPASENLKKDGLVREIGTGYAPDKADGGPTKPTRITTADELAKAIPEKGARDLIAKQFDLDKEELLFFAWTGSNTDRLSFQVEQTETGPVAVFGFVKGRGEDRPRPKCRLFAVAKNWCVVERTE
jgi:hypothetical protein